MNDGAAVKVSMVGFGKLGGAVLDGASVPSIHADLTADIDVTKAGSIMANLNVAFQGVTPRAEVKKQRRLELGLPSASFNLAGDDARRMLREPSTVKGEPITSVVRPYLVADDITTRPLDRFIVNFGIREKMDAALFEQPFAALENVRLNREQMDDAQGYPWWHHWRPRPTMLAELSKLYRYISIPRHAKHHLCVWTSKAVVPGDALVVIARDDDTSIGIVQSRIHEVWALRTGSSLEDRPRYTPTTCFESFPFPAGLEPNVPAAHYEQDARAKAISVAAQALIQLRDHYLNPPEWVEWTITPEEHAADFPTRPIPKSGFAAELKKRTLTNLYNASPTWLILSHEALDKAVAAAYGWHDYSATWTDAEILRRLLALGNQLSGAATPSLGTSRTNRLV